jgi:hypothetical protein
VEGRHKALNFLFVEFTCTKGFISYDQLTYFFQHDVTTKYNKTEQSRLKHIVDNERGHTVVQWLRHCATNRKVAGSIPDGVIGIFHSHNPSDRTMALGLIQPLTEISIRNISWG